MEGDTTALRQRPFDPALLQDFIAFSRLHIASQDVDPLYHVLKEIQRGMDPDTRLLHSLVYVAFYHLPSAMVFWDRFGEAWDAATEQDCYMPTGVERRSLRGGTNMRRHLIDLDARVEQGGGVRAFLTRGFGEDPEANWAVVQENIKGVWGNGRWAGYKLAEVLQKVNGLNLKPTDMGNQNSTGPKKGMEILKRCDRLPHDRATIAVLDEWGEELHAIMEAEGITLDIAEVETCLCDFKSMFKGKYYVGHDIDGLQEDAMACPHRHVRRDIFQARVKALPGRYLGEVRGWMGVSKTLNKRYKDTGEIGDRGA